MYQLLASLRVSRIREENKRARSSRFQDWSVESLVQRGEKKGAERATTTSSQVGEITRLQDGDVKKKISLQIQPLQSHCKDNLAFECERSMS